jgi:hypothetical protein
MGSYVKFGTGSQGDTYTLSASQDGNNVDVLLDAGSGTDSTLQLTAGNNITLTRNNAQEVEIASSGGGGGGSGTVTVQKNVYTGDGSDVTFNTTTAIVNENNVQVYIDGVYQSKDNYTTSGSTVTMSTAPSTGTSVELIHMVAIEGVIARDSFTGNGSTTAYVLSMSISNENATQVYLDGVYQSKNNYSTSGSTLTFSTAPPNGTAIEVVHIKAVSASSLNQNNFTGNGSTTAFTLSQTIDDETKTFVFIQGVYQEKSTYSISGTTLTFSTAPQNGYTIEVMAFSTITVGNATISATDWQSTIQTSNFTAAAGKGYFVNTTSGTVTVSLPAGTVGDEIHFTDYTGTFNTNPIVFSANGSEKIQGATVNKQYNINNGTVRLIYQDATEGWTADNLIGLPFSTQYLVIAGGGGAAGGHQSGGGGAGGYRNSYASETSGGGGSTETPLGITPGVSYTVTVGAGGAAGAPIAAAQSGNANKGGNGSNSVFATVTSIGGGGSASYYHQPTPNNIGKSGGSGGGAGAFGSSVVGNTRAAGTANQGYAGGGASGYAAPYAGAGGGGAGAVGSDASGAGLKGHGGVGLSSSITGSAVFRGGGGGGAPWDSSNVGNANQGLGGNGGGGNSDTRYTSGTNQPGTANTGGGGGGAAWHSIAGAAGGSGVIILRYPNTKTITIGSGLTGTTTTVGSDKVTTFTAGDGTITFSE